MKKEIYFVLFTYIFCTQTIKSFSQNYLSLFGDSSTTWSIIPFGACDNVCSELYPLGGDTVVNSNSYKIIPNLGFIREDTVQGKVWFYDTYFNAEYLVMDLSLNLNDTFLIYDLLNVPFAFTVDSVFYTNTLKHVRLDGWISMCTLNEKITFIEGSGSNASFHYQRQLNGNTVPTYMLCHYKNGIKVAGNLLFNDLCDVCEVGINENKLNPYSLTISPNPFSTQTTLHSDKPLKDASLTVYNLFGQEVKEMKNISGQSITLQRDNLPDGLYFIRLFAPSPEGEGRGEVIATDKLIITNN
jgi:hypothetical protein